MARARGPNMKATLERHVEIEPTKYHYAAAAKGLRQIGIAITANQIPRMHHVRELMIWIDTVRWCAGDSNARTALIDRLVAKESRVVVDTTITDRRSVAESLAVPIDQARAYMDRLEGDHEETATDDPIFH